MQLHFRFSLDGSMELFVLISKLRMAASNSLITDEAPCMEVPPVMLILVFEGAAGEEVREAFREELLLLDLKSEIRVPAAEGGGFGVGALTLGFGFCCRAKVLLEELEAVAGGTDFFVM